MKSIFITGCSSGIGLLAAQKLRDRGYRVITSCRKQQDYDELKKAGFEVVLLDLDDKNSVEQAAKKVIELTNNQLYALFNNAGFGIYGRLDSISRDQLETQFSTNFFAVHQLTMLLLPSLKNSKHARIIQTSSVVGIVATKGRGAYTASKFALEAWSDTLRLELASSNIKVCLIEPGPLATKFSSNVLQVQAEGKVKNPKIASMFALTPEAVMPKLIHALESRRPKVRYRVTLLTTLSAFGKRILPDKLMDKILSRQK